MFPGLRMTRSIRFRVGVLYFMLAVLNVLILTSMIFENQLDMLRLNFRLQADRLAVTVLPRLGRMDAGTREGLRAMDRLLVENHILHYQIFDDAGDLAFERAPGASSVLPKEGKVDPAILRKTFELREERGSAREEYSLDLNDEDYSAQYVIPLSASVLLSERPVYIAAVMRVTDFEARYRQLFIQSGIAAGIVFLAHVIFALLVARFFFRRIGLLANASEQLAAGDLSARAGWDVRGRDELDLLGDTFNQMASQVEGTIRTISNLNHAIQNELTIGKEVQEKFLPDAEKLVEWKAAVYFRPLREVSGDVYSLFDLQGKRAVFFADASGHGVSAALVTGLALFALERGGDARNLKELADHLNSELVSHLKTMFYMTAALVLLDGQTLYYVNAGHPPPLILKKDGTLVELDPTGPPLGIHQKTDLEMKSIPVRSGDRIFFYTDGLIDAGPDADEALLKLKDAVRRTGGGTARDVIAGATSWFEAAAENIIDDVTALCMEIP